MKFSEMPYTRPDIDAVRAELGEVAAALETSTDAQAQFDAVERLNETEGHVGTLAQLAYIRHSIDTRDAFYDG